MPTSIQYLILCVLFLWLLPTYSRGAYFKVEPEKQNLQKGDQFDVLVSIDTEGEEPKTVEAQLLFDGTQLKLISATAPSDEDKFYPVFLNRKSTSKVNVGGSINPSGEVPSGTGDIAILKFEAMEDGVHVVNFNCTEGDTRDTNINVRKNGKPTDIVDCSKLNEGTYTVGEEDQPTPTARLSPSLSTTTTQTPSPSIRIASGSPTLILTAPAPLKTATPTPTLASGGMDTTLTIVGVGLALIGISVIIKVFIL